MKKHRRQEDQEKEKHYINEPADPWMLFYSHGQQQVILTACSTILLAWKLFSHFVPPAQAQKHVLLAPKSALH